MLSMGGRPLSLKAIHLLFIALSVILAVGLGIWGIRSYAADGVTGHVTLALFSFAAAVGLVVYAVRFLRKLKGVSFL